jgi:hypothetical protein
VTNLDINGKTVGVDLPAETPLLWTLRDELGLTAPELMISASRWAPAFHLARIVALLVGVSLLALVLTLGAAGKPIDDFHTLMDSVVARMHGAMHVAPSGDPDRDFARMMIPHHQGAIDMALLQLRFGKDERLRRLAQGIIVEQGQEIQVMRSILGQERQP